MKPGAAIPILNHPRIHSAPLVAIQQVAAIRFTVVNDESVVQLALFLPDATG
jgi:hypothetical protein